MIMTRTAAAAILVVAVLSGCAMSATPRYDTAFGEAVRQSRAMQVANPDAGRTADPVVGIDARAARASIERYQDSFKTPTPTFEVLNIGGSSLTGGAGR